MLPVYTLSHYFDLVNRFIDLIFFFLIIRQQPRSTLFPYTTLFRSAEIKFLGHIIGRDGRKVDPNKVEKVKNYPRPENISQLRGFLGLASYYRKFVKDFSKKVKPMTKLLEGMKRGAKKSKWEKEKRKGIKDIEFIEKWG